MKEPRLELFDLENLVMMLNESLAKRDEVIELGEFEHREPKRNPFLYRLIGEEVETRGKFPLRQTVFGRGLLDGFLGLDSEINLGYVFVETGYTDASSNYSGKYETLRLRIKHPLELKNGEVIPNCSIKLLQEIEEGAEPSQYRRDHVRYSGLVWVRSDLSKVLPFEWFSGGRKAEDYKVSDRRIQPAQ